MQSVGPGSQIQTAEGRRWMSLQQLSLPPDWILALRLSEPNRKQELFRQSPPAGIPEAATRLAQLNSN